MYQKLGVMAPYFTDRGHISRADAGRFNVTGDPRDMHMFKVPSLRNVELTPPYSMTAAPPPWRRGGDDGEVPAWPQLTDQEVELIVEFLKTLTANGTAASVPPNTSETCRWAAGAALLLTFLFIQQRPVDPLRHDRFMRDLQRMKQLDAEINRDLP